MSFAATDPSGGAGLQADILTISSMGCHPLLAVTAITVQDTSGVEDVMAIDPTGEFLYVSNKTSFRMQNKVAVINLKTNRQVLSLIPGPVGGTRVPVGIAFK